jgi:hypothetical protein
MLVEAAWALCGLCCIPVFIQSGLESRVQSLNQRPLFALDHPKPPFPYRPAALFIASAAALDHHWPTVARR